MATNKKLTSLRDCSNPSTVEVVGGAFVLGMFVSVWLGSIASPVVLIVALVLKWHLVAAIIVGVTIVAYLPWKRGYISRVFRVNVVDYYHPRYYPSCRTLFEPSSLPGDTTEKNFLYAIHPHGAFCLGWSTLYHSDAFRNVRFCFSPALFASPFFRLWCRLTGCPGNADKASMNAYMKKNKQHLALPPGGFEEATLSCLTQDRVYIKKRAGFVKLCLQHGYDICPVYCFGEKQTFWNLQGAWNVRLALNGAGVPAIVIWGCSWWPLLPRRTPMLVVSGPPLQCPHIPSPTRDEVKLWHDKYMAALARLFDEHKVQAYGDELGKTAKLEMW